MFLRSRKVLQMSYDIDDSGTVVWQLALCLFLTWFIVFLVLIKGVGSLGKASVAYHIYKAMFVASFHGPKRLNDDSQSETNWQRNRPTLSSLAQLHSILFV
jgi:Sodium:neurotransmitter symporter family